MTDHLLAHDHSELDAVQSATFTALAAGDIEQSFQNLDVFWARLAMHIRAENVHLFPTLLQAAEKPGESSGRPALEAVQTTIAQLRDDHDFFMNKLTAAMKDLRDLRRGKLSDPAEVINGVTTKLTSVSQRLESHNALEESIVYHWANALLDEPQQKTLSEAILRELENLPPRLRKK